MMHIIISIVVQGYAVELEEGICDIASRRGQAAIQRHTLECPGSAQINTFALLDVAEVDSINPATLVGDNRWFHVSNQSPLCSSEEGMHLDIRSTCASAEPSVLVLDQ